MEGEEKLFTYCASCVGNFKRKGFLNSYYILPLVLNIEEEVQTTVLDLPESQDVLKAFVEQGEGWEWTENNLHEKLETFRGEFKEKGIKPKATMWAIRGAVTGRTRGADMTATLDIIGKENCLARAKKAIK